MDSSVSRDLRLQRQAQDRLDDALEMGRVGAANGSQYMVGKTVSDGTYPTRAKSVYCIRVNRVAGAEKEGDEVQFVSQTVKCYAGNLGTSVPPEGTPVALTLVPGGRFVFAYCGPEDPPRDE